MIFLTDMCPAGCPRCGNGQRFGPRSMAEILGMGTKTIIVWSLIGRSGVYNLHTFKRLIAYWWVTFSQVQTRV
jgi:hypothetical protein